MRPLLDADDHDSDDSDCCDGSRAPLGCFQTTVFVMRVIGEDDDEAEVDIVKDRRTGDWTAMESESSKSEIMDALGGWATVKKSRRPLRPKNPKCKQVCYGCE